MEDSEGNIRKETKQYITRKELEEGTEFEIYQDYDGSNSDSEDYDEAFSGVLEDEETEKETVDKTLQDLSFLSLSELKAKMTPLTEDKLVMKLVIQEGTGPVISQKAIVRIHYHARYENSLESYDSTYRRNKPHKFLLNSGSIVEGLDIAVGTMRKSEIAKVWVHYSYAYGEMGCPPRIPSCINILYEVELLNFLDTKDAVEFEEMSPEEQKKAPFDKVFSVTRAEHDLGNEMFNEKRYGAAIAQYQRAAKLLEDVSVANEEEDKRRTSRLLKLYLNLSLCNLKLKRKRCLLFSRKALNIDETNTKALFRHGQGLLMDNEFDEAKKFLIKARRNEPYNQEINDVLRQLQEKRNRYQEMDKNFCKNIFRVHPDQEDQLFLDVKSYESEEFVEVIKEYVEKFKESPYGEYPLSSNYTPKQVEVIKSIVQSAGMFLIEKVFDGEKVLKIMKRND